jgi:hypothetical protein
VPAQANLLHAPSALLGIQRIPRFVAGDAQRIGAHMITTGMPLSMQARADAVDDVRDVAVGSKLPQTEPATSRKSMGWGRRYPARRRYARCRRNSRGRRVFDQHSDTMPVLTV